MSEQPFLWAQRAKYILFATAIAWVPALVLLWLYETGTSDEGAYHYQAFYLSKGYMPVLEFFTTHTVWAYLPYAAVIKVLSPSLEAARAFSIISIIANVAMVTALARKHYGWEAAAYAFVMTAFSWVWLDNNIEVRHSAPANLGLVFALFVLFQFERRVFLRLFLAGIAMGISVNSRVVLIPLAIFFPFVAFHLRRTIAAEVALPRFLSAFVFGLLIPSLPSLYLLVADHRAFFFNYLFHRVSWSGGQEEVQTVWEWVKWIAETRGGVVVGFFFARDYLGNALLLLPVLSALIAALSWTHLKRFDRIRTLADHPLLLATTAMIAGIYVSYCFADRINYQYLHHWIPFLALLGLGFYARAAEFTSPRIFHWLVRISLLVGLFVLMADFGTRVAVSTILRGDPFFKRPLEISRVACWIDRNMAKDAVVMDYLGAVVAVSGRRQPRGYEQGLGVMSFFWKPDFPETFAKRFKIMSLEHYQTQLKTGEIQILIDQGLAERRLPPVEVERIQRILNEHYYQVAGVFKPHSYRIFAHKLLDPATLTPYIPTPWFRKGKEGRLRKYFEQGAYVPLAREALSDVATSLTMLPADLASSFHRLIGGDYKSRCGRLLVDTS